MGLALMMEYTCDHESLCLRPLEPEIVSGCVLVWKKNQTLSPAMARFIGYVKKYFEMSELCNNSACFSVEIKGTSDICVTFVVYAYSKVSAQ